MTLIDGKAISKQVKQEIAAEVAEIVAQGGKRPTWQLSLWDTTVAAKLM